MVEALVRNDALPTNCPLWVVADAVVWWAVA